MTIAVDLGRKANRIVHDVLYRNCTNGSALLNKGAARALDKKYVKTSPVALVQMEDYFTELFLMMPSTNIDQLS